jgi:hypothetical protein
VWARGTDLDLPVLRSAFARCSLPVPWHYGTARDVRTLLDAVFGVSRTEDLKAAGIPIHEEMGLRKHDAVDDCIVQAWQVVHAWKALKSTGAP